MRFQPTKHPDDFAAKIAAESVRREPPTEPDLSDDAIRAYTDAASITTTTADLAAIREEFIRTYAAEA